MGNLNCISSRTINDTTRENIISPLPGRDFTNLLSPYLEISPFVEGKFMSISALTVDNNGLIYATDTASKRVIIFNSEGVFVYQFSANEIGQPHFKEPWGIAVWDERIYVTDIGRNDLQFFTLSGDYIAAIQWVFDEPKGIALSSQGILYVTDDSEFCVQVFNRQLENTSAIGKGKLYKPCDVKIDSTNSIYVLDWSDPCMHVFTSNGDLVREFATRGDRGEIFLPYYFVIDQHGTVIISDSWEYPITVYSPQGVLVKRFPGWGNHSLLFHIPRGLAIGKHNELIVGHAKQGIKIF